MSKNLKEKKSKVSKSQIVERKKIDDKNKIKLIWIDKKNEVNNAKYFEDKNNENKKVKMNKHLTQIIEKFQDRFSVSPFTNLKEGVEELKKIKFQHCYVILSGRYFQDYIDIMKEEGKNLKCVPNVFVFTSDEFSEALNKRIINKDDKYTKQETLNYVNDRFYNIGGVFSGMTKINDRINQLEKQYNIDVTKSDIYNKDKNIIFESEILRIKESNQKMFTFQIKKPEDLIFPSVYNKFISYEEKNKETIKGFLNSIKKINYYEKTKTGQIFINDLIKPLIDLIDVKNFPEEILIKYLTYIYSLESGFYKDMNKYLSTKGKQGIYETFITLMYRGLYLDVFAKNQEYNKLKLYRAQFMNKEEVTRIKKLYEKKNDSLPAEILFSNSFLSFTYNDEAYHRFLRKDKDGKLITILFVIENGADLDFSTLADLEGLSKYYKEEKEILFFPFSSFTIESIEENCNDYILKKVNGEEQKENIVVTKIKLNYLGKYKKTIKETIKIININEFMLNLKDDDFYKEAIKFNITEKISDDKVIKIEKNLKEKIQITVETMQSLYENEEYINKLKNILLSNVIHINSKKLIENNEDNFYAYSDKKKENFSLIFQNKDSGKNEINNDEYNNYLITDEYSNSMINYIYELKDGRIVICCFDNQIKIISKNYTYKKFYFEQRLKDHNNIVTSIIELNNGKLCSCSFDGTIKLWIKNDSNHYSQETNLITQTDSIFYTIIEVNKNNIVGLMKNYKNEKKSLLIYSIENKNKILINIDEIELFNKNLINIDNETFAFGGSNKIFVFNLKGEKIKELNLNFSVICLYKLNSNGFLISNNEGKLFLIDDFNSTDSLNQINYSKPENMIHKIISIEQFKDNTVITRSKSKIYIWKMK